MRIYDAANFPNPRRVRLALREKGALDQVEFVPVDVKGGELRTPAMRAMNPDATVPFMKLEDGTVIGRCTPIIEYIDSVFEGPSLTGDTAQERALIHAMNLRVEEGLLNAGADYFHHATAGLGPELETDQVPAWGERQKRRLQDSARYLDGVLDGQAFLVGDKFTMVDITAYVGLNLATALGLLPEEKLEHLERWKASMAARFED
ncbi:MAG: glutathione S-transferase [Sphingomonadales bacterium BRH_c42]|nr:MAG: glutathione S-transferase [Sphingomonadales bacterium BRH_c42]